MFGSHQIDPRAGDRRELATPRSTLPKYRVSSPFVCGIVGSVGGDRRAGADLVTAATPRLHHRGPDARAVRHFDTCSLGHTRLRILDLTPAGDQPMHNESRTASVVFNGEIYNFAELRRELEAAGHRFISSTDTEVLVHLYDRHGAALAPRLRGMFAFAVWDEAAQRLVLGRDRLGIKPLYYRVDNGGALSFASEARLLARPVDRIDPESLTAYLRLGWVPGPRTIWTGVTELLPGHTLVWERGAVRVAPFWQPSADGPAGAGLADLLADAARRHLVADVPVGLFLSSGVDSAVVGSFVRQSSDAVRAFTVAGDWADEAAGAVDIASRLGLEHEIVPVEGRTVRQNLDRFFAALDQPTVDGLNTWVISGAVRNAGLVVALSGLGGDELFGGYSTFRHVPRLVWAGRATAWLPPQVAALPERALARTVRTAHSRPRRASEALGRPSWGTSYAAVRGLFGGRELAQLRPDSPARDSYVVEPSTNGHAGAELVRRLELANYLPFQLLRDTDVMSMAHSLEVRVPLLDDGLVGAVFGRQHAGNPAWGKADMVGAADPTLSGLAEEPKRTFTLPIGDWMRGPLRDEAFAALVELGEAGLGFDRRGLTSLWDACRSGTAGWRPVWALVVLARWLGTPARVAA